MDLGGGAEEAGLPTGDELQDAAAAEDELQAAEDAAGVDELQAAEDAVGEDELQAAEDAVGEDELQAAEDAAGEDELQDAADRQQGAQDQEQDAGFPDRDAAGEQYRDMCGMLDGQDNAIIEHASESGDLITIMLLAQPCDPTVYGPCVPPPEEKWPLQVPKACEVAMLRRMIARVIELGIQGSVCVWPSAIQLEAASSPGELMEDFLPGGGGLRSIHEYEVTDGSTVLFTPVQEDPEADEAGAARQLAARQAAADGSRKRQRPAGGTPGAEAAPHPVSPSCPLPPPGALPPSPQSHSQEPLQDRINNNRPPPARRPQQSGSSSTFVTGQQMSSGGGPPAPAPPVYAHVEHRSRDGKAASKKAWSVEEVNALVSGWAQFHRGTRVSWVKIKETFSEELGARDQVGGWGWGSGRGSHIVERAGSGLGGQHAHTHTHRSTWYVPHIMAWLYLWTVAVLVYMYTCRIYHE